MLQGLSPQIGLDVFDAQLGSRHLDLAARWLRSRGKGFYTIGSAGHESNAAVAAALRPTDPALLHYRSGGFFLARAKQVSGSDPLRDVLLGLVAATEEPISGGRHKVFGRHDLNVIPQTSTIASHLPRALGVAFSIGRARKLGVDPRGPQMRSRCAASATRRPTTRPPSAPSTPRCTRRIRACRCRCCSSARTTASGSASRRHGAGWRAPTPTATASSTSVPTAPTCLRRTPPPRRPRNTSGRNRRPAFLHLRTVRLMGHAGSDYEPAYRKPEEITADFDRDPVLCTAKLLVGAGVLTPQQVLDRYEANPRQDPRRWQPKSPNSPSWTARGR